MAAAGRECCASGSGLFHAFPSSYRCRSLENHSRPFEMRVSNGLESDVASDCKIESAGAGTLSRAWVILAPHAWFSKARVSRRSQSNEGSLWLYQGLISADSFAPTASVVRAGFPLTLPERRSKERILGASFANLSLSAARGRAPGGDRLPARASVHGCRFATPQQK